MSGDAGESAGVEGALVIGTGDAVFVVVVAHVGTGCTGKELDVGRRWEIVGAGVAGGEEVAPIIGAGYAGNHRMRSGMGDRDCRLKNVAGGRNLVA